jgi:predicted metal-binding membrane protein
VSGLTNQRVAGGMRRLHALDRHLLLPATVLAVAAVAGGALAVWGASPYARYLHHESLGDGARIPALFILGWLLMSTAMMLPTATPLLLTFQGMLVRRGERRWLLATTIAAFLGVWLFIGVVAYSADAVLHVLVAAIVPFRERPYLISAVLLGSAGAYQFTDLSRRCLTSCRSPMSFLARYWTGRRDAGRQALRIGLSYGWSCAGCCLPLMGVMFAVGMSNPAWMLGLTLAMIAQKQWRHGRWVATVSGATLLSVAVLTLITNL